MSKLTKLIKEVVGKTKSGSGRGQKWMWLVDELDGKTSYKRGYKHATKVINDCINRFNYYLLKRNVNDLELFNHLFVVNDKKGNFVGVFQLNDFEPTDNERIVIVDYCDRFQNKEEFLNYNNNYENVEKFERIS